MREQVRSEAFCWSVYALVSVPAVALQFVQGVLENFDDVFMAVGSGGTACGIAIANYLTGSKLRCVCVCVRVQVCVCVCMCVRLL